MTWLWGHLWSTRSWRRGWVDALVATGLVDSRNAARRVLGEGGVSVNNAKVSDPDAVLGESDFLHGYAVLLRRGRKAQAAARLRPSTA